MPAAYARSHCSQQDKELVRGFQAPERQDHPAGGPSVLETLPGGTSPSSFCLGLLSSPSDSSLRLCDSGSTQDSINSRSQQRSHFRSAERQTFATPTPHLLHRSCGHGAIGTPRLCRLRSCTNDRTDKNEAPPKVKRSTNPAENRSSDGLCPRSRRRIDRGLRLNFSSFLDSLQ